MKNSTRFALTTLAAAAAFGTAGAVGTAASSADTLSDLDPRSDHGAYCVVVDDHGDELYLYSSIDCSAAQSRIDADERREERKEERTAERAAE